MNEKPIERLKFYNGQRLEADDLRLEQEYHMRVRRWLNKSLYSAGIAHGLEVRYEPGRVDDKGRAVLVVTPGLALDIEGREMILVEEGTLPILGKGGQGAVTGNYVFIQYNEETRAEEDNSCNPRGNGKRQLAWGGPSRVRATPILGWSDEFPHESSGKVVLAQVELNNQCKVKNIFNYPRRYIGPASNAMVRQYALEGERHIDSKNPGRIYFHIRGRQPNAVTLYLRAEKFSTLYYSELGKHDHDLNIQLQKDGNHQHDLGSHMTRTEDAHDHLVASEFLPVEPPDMGAFANIAVKVLFPLLGLFASYTSTENFRRIAVTPQYHFKFSFAGIGLQEGDFPPVQQNDGSFKVGPGSAHSHNYGSDSTHGLVELTLANDANSNHTHQFSKTDAIEAGVVDEEARSGKTEKALTYVDDLQIYIGRLEVNGKRPDPGSENNFTNPILTQLKNARPLIYNSISKLGDIIAGENDPLANNGTGPIRLDLLSNTLSFPEGEYYIELKVASGGGRILYNLYIE